MPTCPSTAASRAGRFSGGVRAVAASVALGLFFFLTPLPAWNETGHRVIAAIAYDHLTPQARSRADDLIRRHPDYQLIFLKNAPSDPALRARAAFMAASSWPDTIRSDSRFYDDTRPGVPATSLLPGFPDMGRHSNWHYINFNFSTDGTTFPPVTPPHLLSELQRLLSVLQRPAEPQASYALPWILHLVGDAHNPLHTVSRYSRGFPQGDRGGGIVLIRKNGGSPTNLHAFWDELPGTASGYAGLVRLEQQLVRNHKPAAGSARQTDPSQWVREGVAIARSLVYRFEGQGNTPIVLGNDYRRTANTLAQKQIVLAGLRLAEVLNRHLD